MSEIDIGDYVCMSGGKWKGFKGVVEKMKPTFCLVEMKVDKKGQVIHTNTPSKVKRGYMELVEPVPIEMPTMDDCVVVDDVEPTLPKEIFEVIDNEIAKNKGPFLPQAQDKVYDVDSDHEDSNPNDKLTKSLSKHNYYAEIGNLKENVITHENGVKEHALSMDEAYAIRDERDTMKYQLESMVEFQNKACKEIGELKLKCDKLEDELYWKHKEVEDAVNHYEHNKLEKIREILDAS
jgi:hypothetical protein